MSDLPPEVVPTAPSIPEPEAPVSDSIAGGPGAISRSPFLSTWGTILCSILVALLIGSLFLSSTTQLDKLDRSEESLERLVSREMELRDALNRASEWERRTYTVLSGDKDTLNESVGWYDELVGVVESPLAQLYRVVLLAEAGQAERVSAAIVPWEFRDEGTARMAGWIRAAYLGMPPDAETGRKLVEEIRDGLPAGWFADVLVARVAAGIGDRVALSEAESAIAVRGDTLLYRHRVLVVGELALLSLGVIVLGWIRGRRSEVRVGEAPVPPSWMFQDGYGLFIRGVLGFLVISALVPFVLDKETPFVGVATLVAGAPLMWWTLRYLSVEGISPQLTFGLQPPAGGVGRVASVLVVLIGLSVAGEVAISVLFGVLHIQTHWADGLLEDLLWGPPWFAISQAFDSVVWAPFVEEIAFRGVLYATLRTRMRVWPAVLVSAGIFAFAHGYSVMGFASVFWSGTLWALAYEHTRSLLPGMLAHAVNNLLVTLEFVWLLRV